jgi:hypothetical protein
VEPGDRAPREQERLRESANLDPAELTPDPVAVLARVGRRFHLGWLALALAALVGAHIARRLLPGSLAGARRGDDRRARPAGGRRAAGRCVRASHRGGPPRRSSTAPRPPPAPSARCGRAKSSRAGASDAHLRVEDSAGARGWAHGDDVWPLDRPPQP